MHAALLGTTRFLIDLRIGPRTLELARALVSLVALCWSPEGPLAILADDHRRYPQAILRIFGITPYRRRRSGRGRKKHPDLKPPSGLLVGIASKLRDASGNLVGVKPRRL
jgi:hypothetical protein